MNRIGRLLRETSFSRQLSIVVAVAVLSLAFVSSLATSWQSSHQIRDDLIEQGRRITDNLAGLSKLALLYDAPENAAEAMRVTLAFPDIVALEIRRVDGRLLVREQADGTRRHADAEPPPVLGTGAHVETESDNDWCFVAPVLAGGTAASPFDASDKGEEVLGYVRVTRSKATLTRMHAQIFAVNFAVSFFFAFVFLFFVRFLSQRMTRPLTRLSRAMAQAEAGAANVRAEEGTGPKDIGDMAHAFNKMMAVLEEREAELREARDKALKFAKLKADFAATVSHEIRTPLNGVVGTLDILMAADLPSRQRQFVEIAWDSSQYLLDLINNILDFSKLEADKVVLERTEFGVAHMIEDVIELLSPQSLQKGLDFGYLVAPDVPPRVLGDPRRVRQVLINLIGNALKFTDSGGVEVNVAVAARAEDELTLRFEVADSGIGIAPEAQATIFDSFTQADGSTTRRFGGTGLGLAICKQLVALMGGSIGVTSVPGRGSRFHFTVRLAVPEAPPQAETPQTPRWPGVRALVADESEIARRFLHQALAAWGFDCHAAIDADSALAELRVAAARGEPYQLVIVDTLFSVGGESLPLLIHREFRDGLKLVLMNRYGAEHVPAAVQADAYLAKPLCLDRLRESIVGAMGSGAERPATATVAPPERRGRRVLVVEDNHTNQIIAEGMLGVLGCDVGIAASGQEGLLFFKRGVWDLIFMDCNMPDMDGYQVTAAIRAIEDAAGRRTPIVAMTANVQASDVEKCLASGMDDHLAKPLTLETVGAKLERWIPGFVAEPAVPAPVRIPAATGGDEPIDLALLARLREALGGAVGLAIQPFLEDMPAYLEDMEQAVAAGDAEALRRAAHAVKGASGNLGAAQLAAVAREIEELAEAALVTEAGERLSQARAEYAMVQQALLEELKNEPESVPEDASRGALVLVVDDDRSTRSALRYALQRAGFAVEEAGDGARALAMIERIVPDVILMDAMMPEMDGFTACARLQEAPRSKDIPVLMITALDDPLSIERAFAAGASDYIAKPINFAVVNQRVRRVVEANRAEQHVRRLAFNDSLTGLPNRVLFAENLNRAIESAESNRQALAVLFLDLDRFKFVNDTLGHEIGDRLLKAVASRIKYCVRSSDCVARLGGDEFTVLLDNLADTAFAANVAQKICTTLASAFEIDGQEIFVSTSIGISVFPGDGNDVSTLLRHADTAMYRAKRGSSGGFEFYEAGMEALVSEHLRLDTSLRRAIERGELRVFYQPKADTASGRVNGMEALVRWNHPERGMISPLEFIPLAEETGLIVPIGAWVLRTACVQMREWLAAGISDLNVAVNLSGVQLAESNFAEEVKAVLRDTGLDAHHLTLEITESVLMEHAREAVTTLRELKEIGLRIEIDDFGTGYSSLAYLKRFPVDALKIDRTFTRDMTTNTDDAAIVTGIIALAHSLRLKVVAEGVETQQQRDFLTLLGCDSMQGYYLSEPLPADEFAQRILSVGFPDANLSLLLDAPNPD